MNNQRTSLVNKVLQNIIANKLLHTDDHVVAAVSGGADSVAMLYILHEISLQRKLKITVAHLHHGIRGIQADKDLVYVKSIASKLGLTFVSHRVNVPAIARKNKKSIEMAGRDARYRFLIETAQRVNANVIATAHTLDDQAETIILKLARGAGRTGLSGIPRSIEYNGIRIIRPMLDITRKEIEDFLQTKKILYRQDMSNKNTEILRNCVRHEILPLLRKKLNPQFDRVLARTVETFREEDNYLDAIARRYLARSINMDKYNCGNAKLKVKLLKRLPLAIRRRVLIQWLGMCGYPVEQIEFSPIDRIAHIIDNTSKPAKVQLTEHWLVTLRYENLEVVQVDTSLQPLKRAVAVKIPGETVIHKLGIRIITYLKRGCNRYALTTENELSSSVLLDVSKLKYNKKLYVRSWKYGDRMRPAGMSGSRKLQDIFVDMKIPAERRHLLPIFLCNKEIVWFPGYRMAEGWQVRTPSKKSILLEVKSLCKTKDNQHQNKAIGG